MKKAFTMTLLLAAAAGCWAAPVIKFKEMVVDFGTIQRGKVVDIKFEFENIGDETLKIVDIRPACGCTTATLQKKEYAKGEKGNIPVQFDSRAYEGRVVKTIVILTNDPLQTSVNLTLTGNVKDDRKIQGEIRPDKMIFGKVKVGKSYTQRFTILNRGNADMRILEVQHLPDIHLLFPGRTKTVGPQAAIDVELVFQPLEPGSLITLVKIRTNDNQNPYLLLRVEADIE